MQRKVRTMLLVCAIVIGVVALWYVVTGKRQAKLISPLSDQSKVLGDVAIPIPTFTPTPTVTPSPTPTRKPTPRPTATPTPTPRPTPIIVTSSELETFFSKYSGEYSVDKELLKRIANCESGFNTNASSHGYAGLFQFSEGIWTSTRTLMGQNPDANLRSNAEEAIRTAAFMVSQNHLYIWPNCNK